MKNFSPQLMPREIEKLKLRLEPDMLQAWLGIVETSRQGLVENPLSAMYGFLAALYNHVDSGTLQPHVLKASLLGMAEAIDQAGDKVFSDRVFPR